MQAIICGMWLTISDRNNLRDHPNFLENIKREEDLMEYLGCNENGQNFRELLGDKGVGTFGGSEDHTAIMSCTSGNLHMYSYCKCLLFKQKVAL
jgi:galactokinase